MTVRSKSTAAEQVEVSLAHASRDPIGHDRLLHVGGAAVAVDSGVTVSSYDTDLTGAR